MSTDATRLKRAQELLHLWEKRSRATADGFGSSGGVGSGVYRECMADLQRVLTTCPHPNAIKAKPRSGDDIECIVGWCPDCGAARVWHATDGTAWRVPGGKP